MQGEFEKGMSKAPCRCKEVVVRRYEKCKRPTLVWDMDRNRLGDGTRQGENIFLEADPG